MPFQHGISSYQKEGYILILTFLSNPVSPLSAIFYMLAKSLIYKNKLTLGIKCCHFLNCEGINISGKSFIIFLELQQGSSEEG